MRFYQRPYRVHRRKALDFILPFLIIICIGVAAILAFQLYFTLTDEPAENKIDVYIASGSARFLPWGIAKWQNVYSGMNLLPGDALRTSKDGRTVLRFFNNSVVRIAPNSEIILQEVTRDDKSDDVLLTLEDGEMWLNVKSDPGKVSNFFVRTKNLIVRNTGTVFDVENTSYEAVYVTDGHVAADIFAYEDSEERVIETLDVGVGQEIKLSSKEIAAFKARKTPSVLVAISDSFEGSEWFKWNISEDENPTDLSYIAASDAAEEDESLTKVPVKEQKPLVTDEFEDMEPPSVPVVLLPEPDKREITSGPLALSGTTDADTAKIIIETDSEKYTLSKYVPGSKEWKYVLSETYGNLKPGENKYLIYAEDDSGNKSQPATVIITYAKPTQEVLGDFSAPVVISYSGSLSNEVTASPVIVKGKVKGAVSVFVNDYALSKFKAGDTEWTYYLDEKYGNLLPGTNEYEAYAVNAAGEKSEITKFQVIYKKGTAGSTLPYTAEP